MKTELVANKIPTSLTGIASKIKSTKKKPKKRKLKIRAMRSRTQKRKRKLRTVPAGSFVAARLLTGLKTPEGKLTPALIALERVFKGPNQSEIDLTGCFGLAKAQASIPTERVELQVYKISCVSPEGQIVEEKANGYVVDRTDQSFALKGEIISNQGRVAKMALISSIVGGVGEIISRKAQNIGGANPDSKAAEVLVQNGGQQAASTVAQWYLSQANNLLPTIQIKSGSPVYIVMNEKISVPDFYFGSELKKGEEYEDSFLSLFGN